MTFKEYAYGVLIVSSSEKFNDYMLKMLPENEFYPIDCAFSAADAGRKILEKNYDIVIVNAPLRDDLGIRFALDAADNVERCVLLFVKNDLFEEVTAKVVDYGILTLSKPTSASMISQSIRILCAVREKMKRLEKQSVSLADKMEEIRIVNHAKWLLIDALGMSEEEAHKYIEKRAMDERCTKRKIAELITQTYK